MEIFAVFLIFKMFNTYDIITIDNLKRYLLNSFCNNVIFGYIVINVSNVITGYIGKSNKLLITQFNPFKNPILFPNAL